jgi:hypothetical protein
MRLLSPTFTGRIRWIKVHPDHMEDLCKALVKLLKQDKVRKFLTPTKRKKELSLSPEQWDCLVRLLLHGKRLFPRPDDLRAAGFPHEILEFDLSAGQCFIADGGYCHWAINQADSTDSISTNAVTEDWLLVGPKFIVQQLQEVELLSSELGALRKKLPEATDAAILEEYLNLVPPAYTCSLLSALHKDIELHLRHLEDEEAPRAYFEYTLDKNALQAACEQIKLARKLLSNLGPFFRQHIDRDLLCACSSCNPASKKRKGSFAGYVCVLK